MVAADMATALVAMQAEHAVMPAELVGTQAAA